MGDNVIQKNWQELIRPEKLPVRFGAHRNRSWRTSSAGFGVTLATARAALLAAGRGGAVSRRRVRDPSSIPGVREDVTDIILNIKDIAIKMQGDGPKRMGGEGEQPAPQAERGGRRHRDPQMRIT